MLGFRVSGFRALGLWGLAGFRVRGEVWILVRFFLLSAVSKESKALKRVQNVENNPYIHVQAFSLKGRPSLRQSPQKLETTNSETLVLSISTVITEPLNSLPPSRVSSRGPYSPAARNSQYLP